MKIRCYHFLILRSTTKNGSLMSIVRRFSARTLGATSQYCIDMVRKFDYENFLATLLLPSNIRTSAFAIRAFNIECARVQDSVTDSIIGQMRMKFWEETVENIYHDRVPEHPVAVELNKAVKKHSLSKMYLKRLVTVRSNILTSQIFPTLEEMELYAESTVSSIFYLLLQTQGIQNIHADHAASHLGKAQGITNLIRAIPYNAQRKLISIPQDILLLHNVSHEAIIRGISDKNVQDAIFDVASRAKQHLDMVRSLKERIPSSAYVIFLPAIPVSSYLEKLQLSNFDIFNSKLHSRNNLLPVILMWNKFRRKF